MTHRQIFRHPVGRMPGPARWYLAALAMLSLLLAAAHFAVQAQAQRTMRAAVERLLARYGGSAASVRYHLLRGALNLRDIRIRQASISLHIANAALHVSTRAIASDAPTVTNVRLDGASISLPASVLTSWLAGGKDIPAAWAKALERADIVRFRRGVLRAESQPGDKASFWLVRDISGNIRPRTFQLDARAASGRLAITGHRDNAGWRGDLRLQHLPAIWLARALRLTGAPQADLSGALAWRTTDKATILSGKLELPAQAGVVHLDARVSKKRPTVRLATRRWPLAGWSTALPTLFGRTPSAGTWSGEAEFTREDNAWQLHVARGGARNLVLAGKNLPDWRLDAVDIEGATMDWEGRRGRLAHALIRGASLKLLADMATEPAPSWRWQIGRLDMEDVRPELLWRRDDDADALDQRLALPPMRGRLRMASNGHIEWRAESAGEEGWKLEGKGRRGDLAVHILARQASLAGLRPLLPRLSLIGERGPVRVQGAAHLDLSLRQMPDRWTMQGDVRLNSVELAQGGDVFRAASIAIPLKRVDIPSTQMPDRKKTRSGRRQTMQRSLGDIRVDHWLYQAALHPIPRRLETPPMTDAWPDVLDAAWRIESVVFENGRVSAGNADAAWAEDAWMRIGRLAAGKRAGLRMGARMGGGIFSAKGWLEAYGRPRTQTMRLRLRARLNDALPFFLNDWLAISGAPRLIRGRLSASLDIRPRGQRGWAGKLALTLRHGAAEAGAFPGDPLATLTGFDLQTLLARLGAEHETSLRLRMAGDWQHKPPSLAMLGRALAVRLKMQAEAKVADSNHARRRTILAGVRLYRGRVFTHNERVRLRKVVRRLRREPQLIVELVPRLGAHEPDADITARVRRTQSRIERYMHARGIASRRIYPVWPTVEHRGGDTTGVDIVALGP